MNLTCTEAFTKNEVNTSGGNGDYVIIYDVSTVPSQLYCAVSSMPIYQII